MSLTESIKEEGENVNMEDLIPKFEVGERVIAHDRLVEDACPNCGTKTGSGSRFLNQDIEGEITGKASGETWWCDCGHESKIPEGYYVVRTNDATYHYYPYTLLERVEVSR